MDVTDIAYRFMPARDLMSLIAGNWASFETDLKSETPSQADGLLAVEVPYVRFTAERAAAVADADCRGGVITLDLAPLTEGADYLREGTGIFVLADVLVQQPVTVELQP
ncbi:MAG: hypothetical protein U9R79_07355 [Armatimonadota bacterium]|nr:hypothetical protein [Armatimonadota bacterium]